MAENYQEIIGTVNGLRRGFTTGTTATAAAKAAASCLLRGKTVDRIKVRLPKSNKPFSEKEIEIPVESCTLKNGMAIASVLKDSGDDKDETNGIEIFAEVSLLNKPGIEINAGEGIGRVTGEGLPVKQGNAAINPVPEKMIISELSRLLEEERPGIACGLRLMLSAPKGREIAAKTWNGRIGIEGGISIIGTSGVVEPRSEKAFKSSLALVIKAAAKKQDYLTIISGYVGEKMMDSFGADEKSRVAVGDMIGFALSEAQRYGIKKLFLPLHVGKLTKIAAGLFNTHSDLGDARLETLTAVAGACGASQQQMQQLLDMTLAEEAISLLQEWELDQTFNNLSERAKMRCEKYLQKAAAERPGSPIPAVETAALDLKGNLLGWSGGYKNGGELCRNFM